MGTGARIGHLAIVVDGLDGAGPAAGAAEAFAGAARLLPAALAAGGGIPLLTCFAPQLRDWLLRGDAAVAAACVSGLRRLRGAAEAAGATLRVLGRTDRLPAALRGLAAGGAGAPRPLVGWFLDYSSRDEILRAAGRVAPGAPVGEEGFSTLLDTAGMPDPDLILYVGGAFAPKDFLLWQASYAELWHTPAPWRDFTSAALAAALADFGARERRFGG